MARDGADDLVRTGRQVVLELPGLAGLEQVLFMPVVRFEIGNLKVVVDRAPVGDLERDSPSPRAQDARVDGEVGEDDGDRRGLPCPAWPGAWMCGRLRPRSLGAVRTPACQYRGHGKGRDCAPRVHGRVAP
jgi:hypothetical protein